MQTLLDLKLLTTFVRAAHSGTLSATALQVGRTQSTVTMQIQRLEDALGQTLFHRSGSGDAVQFIDTNVDQLFGWQHSASK